MGHNAKTCIVDKKLFIGLIGFFILFSVIASINIEFSHYDSPDAQYSVITKGSLIKYMLPSFPHLSGAGTSFNEGIVIVRDNKNHKTIEKYNLYTKVQVVWKTDTVNVNWQGFVWSTKLPNPIE